MHLFTKILTFIVVARAVAAATNSWTPRGKILRNAFGLATLKLGLIKRKL